jgi:acetylornithine/N-succinyldiaminopimelate aminotransferase
MEKLKNLPRVKTVRGKGLLIGVEFDSPIGRAVKHGALDRKLLVTLIGDRLIRMVPPLTVSRADCDKAYAILEESVKEAD